MVRETNYIYSGLLRSCGVRQQQNSMVSSVFTEAVYNEALPYRIKTEAFLDCWEAQEDRSYIENVFASLIPTLVIWQVLEWAFPSWMTLSSSNPAFPTR